MNNRKCSIQIRHSRTGIWTHNSSITTNAPVSEIQKQYEQEYKQPVRVVEMTESQHAEQLDSMFNSVTSHRS